jgi:hypothetical protein
LHADVQKVLLLRFFNAIFVPLEFCLIFSQNAGNGISETPDLKIFGAA